MLRPEPWVNIVSGYIALGMFDDAWRELASLAPELRSSDKVVETKLAILHRLGKWQSARIMAEEQTELFPENPAWWIQWATALRREISADEARGVLVTARGLHPQSAAINYELARYASLAGEFVAAQELLQQAFTVDQDLVKSAIADTDFAPLWASVPAG